jgi:hypothetical protein
MELRRLREAPLAGLGVNQSTRCLCALSPFRTSSNLAGQFRVAF